jgi:hypothetical protein
MDGSPVVPRGMTDKKNILRSVNEEEKIATYFWMAGDGLINPPQLTNSSDPCAATPTAQNESARRSVQRIRLRDAKLGALRAII